MPGPYHWLTDHAFSHQGAIVQSLSPAQTFSTPWTVHSKLPCPSLPPWACSNLFPLSQWCHPIISFSVALFSSCPQSFSVSGPFPKSLHWQVLIKQLIGADKAADRCWSSCWQVLIKRLTGANQFTQTHVHCIGDGIQPSHPPSSPSPPAPNPSQHQSFFQWVNSLHEVAKVLEFQL